MAQGARGKESRLEHISSYWIESEANGPDRSRRISESLNSYSNDFSPWYYEFLSRVERYGLNVENFSRLDSAYQIVQKWGGIRRFKRTPENDLRISKIFEFVDTFYPIIDGRQPRVPKISQHENVYALTFPLFPQT